MKTRKSLWPICVGLMVLASCGGTSGGRNGLATQGEYSFTRSSIDDYMSLRAQLDKFSRYEENGRLVKAPIPQNNKNTWSGATLLESDFFEASELYGAIKIEIDLGNDSGKSEIGGFALVDPGSLAIISEVDGAMIGRNLKFDTNGFEADFAGNLQYRGTLLETKVKGEGMFYADAEGNKSMPMVFEGSLTPETGHEAAMRGVGLVKEAN